MLRRTWMSTLGLSLALLAAGTLNAAPPTAEDFVRRLSDEVINTAGKDSSIRNGDIAKIRALVETKVMPHVNFERMTSMAVGPQWRTATPEQHKRMLEEFKTLMMNTYAGALMQINDQTVDVKPMRAGSDPSEALVRSLVRGKGDPIQLDYRLEKNGDAWRIYNVNVGGFWLAEAYKGQFAKDLSDGGLDALISRLAEKNKSLAASPKS